MGQHERAGSVESSAIASARLPPVSGAVDDGVAFRLGVIGVGEVLDPGDHGRMAEAVAFICSLDRVILDIEHAWEGFPVLGPSTSVGEEVLGLDLTRAGVRVGKVVASTDEASCCSTLIVGGETWGPGRCVPR